MNEREGLDAGRRRRGPGCVSNLALDQYLIGELPAGERETLSTHLAGCRTCADVYAALATEQARFAERPLATLAADALARTQRPSAGMARWLRRLAIPSLALCTGAAALVLMARPTDGIRTKGSFSLSAYVLHPERSVTGGAHLGEALHPGDRLQFRYNGLKGGYLTVVSVDDSGEVSVYYPAGGAAAPVEPGRDVALPSAVELDGTLGREVVLAVRCDQPVAVADVVRAARQAAEAARARGRAPSEITTLGLPCDESRQVIAKTDRPIR
jgi:hypothetical protein